MTGTAGKAGGVRRSRFGLILATVALVVGAWTVGWFWVRGEVERRVDATLGQLAEAGLVVTCPERALGGYPFRIELACPDGLAVEDRRSGDRARFVAGRAVALLYRPTHVIVELDGPAEAAAGSGETVSATWSLLQASLRFTGGGLQRLSVAADRFDGRLTGPDGTAAALAAGHVELHGRPDPALGGLDLAAEVKAGTLTGAERRLGPEKFDLAFDAGLARLPFGAGAGDFLAAWAGNDGRLDLRALRLAAARATVEGRGALRLETDGTLTGTINLVAAGLDTLAGGSADPAPPPEVAILASGFMIFGKPAREGPAGGRSLDLVVERGRMTLGRTPLGRLPPLFDPPRGS